MIKQVVQLFKANGQKTLQKFTQLLNTKRFKVRYQKTASKKLVSMRQTILSI